MLPPVGRARYEFSLPFKRLKQKHLDVYPVLGKHAARAGGRGGERMKWEEGKASKCGEQSGNGKEKPKAGENEGVRRRDVEQMRGEKKEWE